MGILGALRKTGEYVDNRPLSPVLSSFPMQIRRPLQNCDFATAPIHTRSDDGAIAG